MRLYRDYIVSGIFLILLIINFAVAAPVLIQEKLQARVDVVYIPKHAMTMLGTRKRAGELDEIFSDAEGHFVRPENSANPEESSAIRPSSSSQPSGLADGLTDVGQPPPSISNEQSVPSPDHAAPSLADEMNKIWLDLIQGHFPSEPEESSAARPSSSSQPSGPASGSVDVEQPLPPFHEELLPVSSQVHASLSTADELNKMWRELIQGHSPSEPEESSVARPSSSSQPSGPASGSVDVERPLPPIHEELLPVSSQVHASLSIADELNKMWHDLIQGHFPSEPEGSSAARPSSSSQPSGPASGSVDVEQPLPPIHEELLPVSSQVHASLSTADELNKMWRDLIQGHSPSEPEESLAGPSQVSNPDRAPLSADDSHGLMKMWLDIIGHPKSHSFAKPLPSISEEPSQVSSSDRAPLSADGMG
ncbi:hypothetical protein BGY98DRAFT_1187795 [Russula aff. rugulosa BPL654]|nr:hypothetical protein BGY98DRAFT_1187795 [Russula aff. rugulosa BPL654]